MKTNIQKEKNRARRAVFVTLAGLVVNICLAGLKLSVGLAARSGALVADAVHSLSDLSTDVIVLGGVFISRKPADKTHPFGHGKVENISAALIGAILFMVALGIMSAGMDKTALWLAGGVLDKPGVWALYVALASLLVKEVLFRFTIDQGRKINSPSVIANAWHQRSDALSSLGAAMGIAGAAFLGEAWRVLDPIASIAVGGCILLAAMGILKQSVHQLMDGAADEALVESAKKALSGAPCVSNPHDFAAWNLAGKVAVMTHVEVDPRATVLQVQALVDCLENQVRGALGADVVISIRPDAATEFPDKALCRCSLGKGHCCGFLAGYKNMA